MASVAGIVAPALVDALGDYIDELRTDETTVGLLVHGSRASGFERRDSDYDLICVSMARLLRPAHLIS